VRLDCLLPPTQEACFEPGRPFCLIPLSETHVIQVQQGVLVERARDVLSFSHLTLQEYLTAQHIADNNLIEQLITEHLCDQRWREVFLLVAGLIRSGADDFLLTMEAEVQKLIETDGLQAFVCWASQQPSSKGKIFKTLKKRLEAISFGLFILNLAPDSRFRFGKASSQKLVEDCAHAFNLSLESVEPSTLIFGLYYARIRSLDRPFDPEFILNLVRELKRIELLDDSSCTNLHNQLAVLKPIIPGREKPLELRRRFADRLLKAWLDALHFDVDWFTFSRKKIKALERYLYAYELIIQCKEAAVRVSPQVWAGIEERMLTVREGSEGRR
jgi:hypothetical protein